MNKTLEAIKALRETSELSLVDCKRLVEYAEHLGIVRKGLEAIAKEKEKLRVAAEKNWLQVKLQNSINFAPSGPELEYEDASRHNFKQAQAEHEKAKNACFNLVQIKFQ
jgi:hypothetical protein